MPLWTPPDTCLRRAPELLVAGGVQAAGAPPRRGARETAAPAGSYGTLQEAIPAVSCSLQRSSTCVAARLQT
eukprot:12400620-Alexandrium_andersonii.AAC.1